MSSFFSEQQKQNARRIVLNQNVILCAYPMMTHSIAFSCVNNVYHTMKNSRSNKGNINTQCATAWVAQI